MGTPKLYAVDPDRSCTGCKARGFEGAEGTGKKWRCRSCWRLEDLKAWYYHKVDHGNMPPGIRKVPFEWGVGNESFDCEFHAGFAGCAPVVEVPGENESDDEDEVEAPTLQAPPPKRARRRHEVRPQVAYAVFLKKGAKSGGDLKVRKDDAS